MSKYWAVKKFADALIPNKTLQSVPSIRLASILLSLAHETGIGIVPVSLESMKAKQASADIHAESRKFD